MRFNPLYIQFNGLQVMALELPDSTIRKQNHINIESMSYLNKTMFKIHLSDVACGICFVNEVVLFEFYSVYLHSKSVI
ncbi:hypothetical protein A1QI_08280 [Vibrio genomosp. F10 str. 9ZB36]|nr:hypothetical protein A1QI_08280 [Vibrio genomosp. F10 str. 9ZB36]